MRDALLELDRVTKSFGSVKVIDGVELRLEPGEALGVVGPNGAGKTTMMNLIAGVIPVDGGRVMLDGRNITRMPAHLRCRGGIGRTHQVPQPFEGLTVFENVMVGLRFGHNHRVEDPNGTGMSMLDRVGLSGRANVTAGRLTLLERKRLELARALATGPRLLLLDEIAGGLTEAEVEQLIESIRVLRSQGLTIIWIEHIVHALLSVVDRLMAIDFGKVIAQGKPHEVMATKEVQAVYLGVGEE